MIDKTQPRESNIDPTFSTVSRFDKIMFRTCFSFVERAPIHTHPSTLTYTGIDPVPLTLALHSESLLQLQLQVAIGKER